MNLKHFGLLFIFTCISVTTSWPQEVKLNNDATRPSQSSFETIRPMQISDSRLEWSLNGVLFQVDSDLLDLEKSEVALKELVRFIKANEGAPIEIQLLAPKSDDPEASILLTVKRTGKLQQYLLDQGLSNEQFRITGTGRVQVKEKTDTEIKYTVNEHINQGKVSNAVVKIVLVKTQ